MSNDNDPRDDAMREIEAALNDFADYYDAMDTERALAARDKLLALIRSKLPQPRSLLELHGLGQGVDHRDPGAWGEDDNRFRANEQAAKLEAWNDVEHGELAQARSEPVRPYSEVRAELFDAEHERAVEAWWKDATSFPDHDEAGFFHVQDCVLRDALRLMRARPASDWEQRFYALADKVKCRAPSCGDIDCGLAEIDDKLQAAGELLRAAKVAREYVGPSKDYDDLCNAIAKAERAGIKP